MTEGRLRKILVVDDDELVRDCCSTLLEHAGYSVECAVDGVEGLNKLKGARFDLVISDIAMPRLDGIAFYLSVLKEHPHMQDRFLFVTGNVPSEGYAVAVISRLDKKIIRKPFKINELLDSVSRHLSAPLWDGAERRKERRYAWSSGSIVSSSDGTERFTARVEDISDSGLRISYNGSPLAIGSRVGLYIKSAGLNAQASVRWSKGLASPAVSGLLLSEPVHSLSIICAVKP